MPDLDRVERTLSRSWRAPYRLLKGGHPPEAVGEELIRRTAEELRRQGGIPGFAAFLRASMGSEAGSPSQKTLGDVSRSLEQRFGQTQTASSLDSGL